MTEMKVGFEIERVRIALENILPTRQLKDPNSNSRRFRVILASIKEVGMIEPLTVHPQKGSTGKYVLLDGHLRRTALLELGHKEAECVLYLE